MATTPRYDALKRKVRDWANRREVATVPEDILEDCLRYGCDDVYKYLRIPQLETTLTITVEAENNANEKYSQFDVPEDLIEFIYLAKRNSDGTEHDIVYNQVNDVRTFLDKYAEQYSRNRYVWKDLDFLVYPKLEVGDVIELHYYRRLGQLDALYSVIPENWDSSYADDAQPLLTQVLTGGTSLWKATSGGVTQVFLTEAEAIAYGGAGVELLYEGVEAWNWLRDANERVVVYAALKHIGMYLQDESMEKRFEAEMMKIIDANNREDKYRKAKGGNVQMNVNTGGLI